MPLHADHELTDTEIVSRYGALFDEADRAFRADSTYVVVIAEKAAHARKVEALRQVRAELLAAERAANPIHSDLEREERRLRIIEMRDRGFSQHRTANALGMARSTVAYYWRSQIAESQTQA